MIYLLTIVNSEFMALHPDLISTISTPPVITFRRKWPPCIVQQVKHCTVHLNKTFFYTPQRKLFLKRGLCRVLLTCCHCALPCGSTAHVKFRELICYKYELQMVWNRLEKHNKVPHWSFVSLIWLIYTSVRLCTESCIEEKCLYKTVMLFFSYLCPTPRDELCCIILWRVVLHRVWNQA